MTADTAKYIPQEMADRIKVAVNEARDKFWASIAASFPEVTSGDYSPGETFAMERDQLMHVLWWLSGNWDTFTDVAEELPFDNIAAHILWGKR